MLLNFSDRAKELVEAKSHSLKSVKKSLRQTLGVNNFYPGSPEIDTEYFNDSHSIRGRKAFALLQSKLAAARR